MMDLLLDSSNSNLSVGLSDKGQLIDFVSYEAWQRQSELMVDEIDKIMKKNNISRQDLSSVVVSQGPGSYTGVRIAMSIAKTIVLALDIPLYLVSSLKVLQVRGSTSVCLSNAQSKRSYIGVYQDDKVILPDQIMDNPQVLSYLEKHPDFVLAGDTAYLGKQGKQVNVLANLALEDRKENLIKESLGARPIYLKDSYSASEIKIIVRPTISADLSSIMRIENESFKYPYSEKQIRYDLLENPVGHLLSAVVDSSVVGFIDYMVTFDSSSINQIAVDERFRKRGVGTRLIGSMLDEFKTEADPVDFVTLEVRSSNEIAHKFYKKHAFGDITVKKAYYEDGEDAIYMVRNLNND